MTMAISKLSETVKLLLDFSQQPYLKAALGLAKAAKIFIRGDSAQVAVWTVAEAKLNSAETAMREMEDKKDLRSAGEGILTDLRGAYYLLEAYYKKMPQAQKVYIPGIWEFNQLHMAVRGTAEVQDMISRVCFLKAVYNKAMGNSPSLAKEWLCDRIIPCDNFEILAGLLGQETAMEYIASNPTAGRRMADQYLDGENVSLEDYGGKYLRVLG